jgi:hypothetical protein
VLIIFAPAERFISITAGHKAQRLSWLL